MPLLAAAVVRAVVEVQRALLLAAHTVARSTPSIALFVRDAATHPTEAANHAERIAHLRDRLHEHVVGEQELRADSASTFDRLRPQPSPMSHA